jgi:hypothetical protein
VRFRAHHNARCPILIEDYIDNAIPTFWGCGEVCKVNGSNMKNRGPTGDGKIGVLLKVM